MADPSDPQTSEKHDTGPPPPIQETDPVCNPNEPPEEQIQQESELPGQSNQRRESGGGKKSFPLPDADLLLFLVSETNPREPDQMKVLDFARTAPNNITVGFFLALVLLVGVHDVHWAL